MATVSRGEITITNVDDGKPSYTHTAYKFADGRFTTQYPNENILLGTTSETQSFTTNSGWPDKTGATNAEMAVGADHIVKAGDILTYSAYITAPADVSAYIYVRFFRPGASNGRYEDKTSNRIDPGTSGWCSVTVTVPSDTKSLTFTVGRYVNNNAVTRTISWASEKAEKSDKRTIYTPAPSEDFANAYPTFVGSYVDDQPTDSEDPAEYTWQRILGESGQDGIAGKDGLGVSSTTITYAQSTSGTTPPTTGWSAQVPTLVKGQYLWTQTTWVYTDNTGESGYTVSYNAKDGNDGNDGIAGKDGVGISSTVVEYVASASGTVKPTTGWSTTIPTVAQGQYLWTRTTWNYTDSTSEQGFSVARQGANGTNGTNGTNGADGKDAQEVFSGYLTNESIVLPANAAGTVSDFSKANGTFVTFLGQNQLSAGVAYSLESATGITTTINATSGAYSVTAISADVGVAIYKAVYNGITIRKQVMVVKAAQGASGVGLTTTTITYQAGTSGTTAPTGTWSATVPTVPAGQFLWTRTIWAFSDGTSKTGYSISKAGETGATGATGATGNGIASSAITYTSSTSGTTVPTSGWQTTIPTVASGSFLWTRTIFTYTNGNTSTSYAVAKQGEKGDPTGILSQNTVPAAAQRYVGMLWKNTGASGYINGATYRWNGSAFELYIFTAENMSVSNLAAISANLGTITAGTINGVTINGSEFINPYTRSYNDGTFAQGTQRIGSAELYNSGVIKNSQETITKSYETIFSHQFVSMARYGGSAAGDQNELIASASLSFDTLTLNDRENGFSGMIHARQLTDTPWINLSYAAGFRTSENNPCQYQISYNMKGKRTITFRGQVERTSGAMTGTTYPFGIGTVPASIRPTENTFKLAAGDATELQTVRVAMLGTAQPSIGNSIQVKVVGNSQYVDISALTYDIP